MHWGTGRGQLTFMIDAAIDSVFVVRPPSVKVHLLGPMQVTRDGKVDALPKARKSRGVLAVLCLAEGRSVSRSRLAGLLWDRVGEQQARASLRQALFELSNALDPEARGFIKVGRDEISLDRSQCWVDALAALAKRPTAIPVEEQWPDASDENTGTLCDDLEGISSTFDHWIASERARFESNLIATREAELRSATSGSSELRIAAARALLSIDATQEHAWRTLIRALVERGDRANALRAYQRCQETLRRLLDIEPSEQTRRFGDTLRQNMPLRNGGGDAEAEPVLPPGRRVGGPIVNRTGRLRVGVLPFADGLEGAAFGTAHALAHQIAAALARFHWFDVIAPLSLPGYRGGPEWRSALEALGLDYAIDGTKRCYDGRLHIAVVALDARDRTRTFWSDHLTAHQQDEDSIRNEIVAPLVARVEPALLLREGQWRGALTRTAAAAPDAAALVLEAIPLLYSMERDAYHRAGDILSEAMALDPADGMVHAWASFWHVFHVGQGWSASISNSYRTAESLSLRATRLDPANAHAFGIRAHVCSFLHKDFESALELFGRSVQLNPYLPFVWALSAPTMCYIGEPGLAIERLDHYRRLAPLDPYFPLFETIYTMAYVFAGDYAKAASVGRRSVLANPDFSNGYKPLLSALGHLGLSEEARTYGECLLRLEPSFTVRRFELSYPFKHDRDRQRYVDGLRRAGLPEQ
jgi:DNA-binding SARP family transcriptional activator/TolB-like protein